MADSSKFDDVENPPNYTERTNLDSDPPNYDAAGPQAPPPSYDSLFGKVKKVKNESSGSLDFMKTAMSILFNKIGFTILLAVFLAIPISMIVMGSIYLDDCPAERMIPIYLIVAGCFGVVKDIFNLVQRCRMSEEERTSQETKTNPLIRVIDCFLFAWFIAGCVWIYRTKGDFQSSHPNASDYCDYTLYWYSFWITTAMYILMALSCLCICVIGLLAACL